MSLSRTNSFGWALGAKLAAAQIVAIDNNIEGALDRRSGQTDTLQSVVSAVGAGRLVELYSAGPTVSSTIAVTSYRNIAVLSTVTVIYTLSTAGAVAGDRINIRNYMGGQVTVVDGFASATLAVIGSGPGATADWGSFLFDGTRWRLYQSATTEKYLYSFEVLSTMSITVPAGCQSITVTAFGGGGGGGGGSSGTTTTGNGSLGGGGGGGALPSTQTMAVTPLENLSIGIGNGGSGGSVGAAGSPGGDTTVTSPTGGTLTFVGAHGGCGRSSDVILANGTYFTLGGPSVRIPNVTLPGSVLVTTGTFPSTPESPTGYVLPSHGGCGRANIGGAYSGHSPIAVTGRQGGNAGSSSGAYSGGGGGGGGGGGRLVGGVAGDGGGGANGGVGTGGTAGSAAAANSAAGGGGGGGGGFGATGGGSGGIGGAGGSGYAIIVFNH